AGGAAAVVDDGENFFVGVELVEIFLELAATGDLGHAEGRALAGDFVLGGLGEIFIAVTLVGSLGDGLYVGVGSSDDNHSGELALVLVEVFFLFDGDANAFAGNDTVGAGCPRLGVHDERNDVGRGHAGVDVLIGPSAAKGTPGFEVSVGEAGGGELVAGPLFWGRSSLGVGGGGGAAPPAEEGG